MNEKYIYYNLGILGIFCSWKGSSYIKRWGLYFWNVQGEMNRGLRLFCFLNIYLSPVSWILTKHTISFLLSHFLLFVCTSLYRHMYQLEQARLCYSNKQLENISGSKQQGFVYSSYLLFFFCQPKEFCLLGHSDTLADVSGIILGMVSQHIWGKQSSSQKMLSDLLARTHGLSV